MTSQKFYFVKTIRRFDGAYSPPGKLIRRVKQNPYGSKTAEFIFIEVLAKHGNEHNIFATGADPCQFIHSHSAGHTCNAVTVENFLVSSNTAAQADVILNIFCEMYNVKYMGQPSTFLCWMISFTKHGYILELQPI